MREARSVVWEGGGIGKMSQRRKREREYDEWDELMERLFPGSTAQQKKLLAYLDAAEAQGEAALAKLEAESNAKLGAWLAETEGHGGATLANLEPQATPSPSDPLP